MCENMHEYRLSDHIYFLSYWSYFFNQQATESSSPSTTDPPDAKKTAGTSAASGKKGSSKQSKDEASKTKPLVPKSAILRLVAELIRSYTGYALVVAQYQYVAGQTEYIREVRKGPGKRKILCNYDGSYLSSIHG